jgi:hypothetical protein
MHENFKQQSVNGVYTSDRENREYVIRRLNRLSDGL